MAKWQTRVLGGYDRLRVQLCSLLVLSKITKRPAKLLKY